MIQPLLLSAIAVFLFLICYQNKLLLEEVKKSTIAVQEIKKSTVNTAENVRDISAKIGGRYNIMRVAICDFQSKECADVTDYGRLEVKSY